jgi:hypothetical protein
MEQLDNRKINNQYFKTSVFKLRFQSILQLLLLKLLF